MPKPKDAKNLLEMLYGAPKPAVSRLDMNFRDVTKRMPELQQAARLYEQGKITREQYYAIIDQLKPVTPYEFIPKPATAEEALAALTSDKVKDFGRTDVLTPGETILSRLDIPAYSKKGTWVTSQHRLKPPADEPKTIYTPTMMLEGETKMMPGTGAARRVAKGEKQKSSFATIRGAYKPGSDEEAVERAIEALRSKDYAQIGYDPERRGFFYDRRTMEPIIGTEEGIIQIGPLVLGKKPIRGNPEDFEYKEGGAVHMQDGGRLPPGIKRATERAKESKSVLPVAGARQARQAIQGYLGMDPSFSVMDPEAQALESAYRGGETASVLGDLVASLTPFAAASAASKANQVPGLAQLIAYHGSPHKFKKFDANKINTGEGAQVYGHGLYFAEDPNVAKYYREKLVPLVGRSSMEYLLNDKVIKQNSTAFADAVRFLAINNNDLSKASWSAQTVGEISKQPSEYISSVIDEINKIKNSGLKASSKETGGALYTVDIPDEKIAQMLDWDKPLSQQPVAMQVAKKVFNDPQRKSAGFPSITDEEIGNLTGQDLYRAMTTTRGGLQPGASKSLLQEGIPGIQYLDQASRDAKQGTRNFVVFPGEEQNIKMLDINGEPQMAAGGAVSMQDGGNPNLYRSYGGHSQEAIDWLNAQNLATGRPYEYDERTKTFTRQGEAGPETLGWEQARDLGRQAAIESKKQYFEANDPFKLSGGDQANLDQYIKSALPNLLEESSRTGVYRNINEFLGKYGISDADVQRIFGEQGPSQDWMKRLNTGDIETTVGGVSYNRPLGSFSYQYRGDMAARPTTTFEQPSWVMEAYQNLDNLSKPLGADKQISTPEWLKHYQSLTDVDDRKVSQGPTAKETSFLTDIANEFARNYGRQITPEELNYFSSSGTSNLVYNQGLDPKDPKNYIKGIAPARLETAKNILRQYEQSPSRYQEYIDPFTISRLGLEPYTNLGNPTLEKVIGAARSENPQNYFWQQNRQLAASGGVNPLLGKMVGSVSGIPIHVPEEKGQTLKVGGIGITNLDDIVNLVQTYGFTSSELEKIADTLNQVGRSDLSSYINRFRFGQISPSWDEASQQAQATGRFFDYTSPAAEYSPYERQVSLAGGLQTLGYVPGQSWLGGFVPPKGAAGGAVRMASGGAVHMQDGGSPLDQFYQPANPMARRAAEQERMRQEIARRRAEELARQQTPLDTSLPGPSPTRPGLPSMADLKGAFERRVMPVISEAKQTAMTGGILGDLARAYGEASVPVNQAMATALGRPFEQERPPEAPPEMTVPTAFERRGDIFQQLAGQAIGDPANLLDPGILRGLEAGARAVKPGVMRGLEVGTQAVKPFAKTAAEMVEEMAMKGVPGTDAMQLRMGILPETPKLPSLTDEALPAPKIESEAPTGGMSIRPEQLELPVSQVVKRGEEVPPMTTPPTPEQVAAARADTRMSADIVADRLNVIVPEAERVLGGIYKPGRPDGGKWSDLTPEELSKNLPGFPGTDADLNRMWDETLSEVSQAARDAVARTGATWQGFPAADFDVAMRLPLRNQLWYELSGEAFVDRVPDASLRESLILLDLVGATSARARPEENLERALAILSQRLRGVPVDVDITIPSTVTQALNRSGTNISSDLANKTGMFSDTIALTGGIPVRYPISVNDVWEGRTYGITDEALSKNQPLHEVFAKYQNKVRDFVNENGNFPYPVQSWNVQALKWVKKRFDDLGIDPLGPASLQGSDYAAEFDKIVNKLERAGIKVPNGQITRDVLLNPKTADALRPTTPGFRKAPKATVEFGTLLTPAGQRAAQIYEAAKNTGDELTQQEYRNILLSAMRDSSRGKPTPWESLARVASDEALSVTRIAAPTQDDPFSISGTFMGAAGPNIRIPLKELTPDQIAYFNSVAGLGLKQKAMAAAEILRLDPDMSLPQGFVPTHSIRFDFSGRVPETMLTDFAKALGEGFEISAMRYPDGMVFDINPRFGDAGPEAATHEAINAATNMLQSTYNAKNLEVFPSAYRSEYGKNYVEDPGNGSEYNRIIKDTLKGWNNEAAERIAQLAGKSVNAKNINAFLAGKLENLPIDRSKVASASELSSIQGKAKTIRKGLRQRLSDHDAALKAFNDIGLAVDSRMAAAIPKWDKRAAAMAKREQTKQGPEPEMAKGGRVHISNNLDTMLLELMRNKRYG